MRSTPQGRPTTDPKAALAGGVVLPIGEHKGSGISMFMDIFGGVISGANFGGEVGDQYKAFDRPQDVGHFFLAMKPDLFVSEDDYRARIDTLIDRMKSSPLAEGFAEVLVPGEPEDRIEAERRRAGIPYAASEVEALQDEAKRAGIQPLVVADRPIGRLMDSQIDASGLRQFGRRGGLVTRRARRDVIYRWQQSGENNAQTAFPAAGGRRPSGGAHRHRPPRNRTIRTGRCG